jgi:hypothetical protein
VGKLIYLAHISTANQPNLFKVLSRDALLAVTMLLLLQANVKNTKKQKKNDKKTEKTACLKAKLRSSSGPCPRY